MADLTVHKLLPNGFKMPLLGLGTWQSTKNEAKVAVKTAIDNGYRHIDTAWIYQNEEEIGEALQDIFKAGTIKRGDLFITTKLWNTFHRAQDVQRNLEDSLRMLRLNYVDLYLMHMPTALKRGDAIMPCNADGTAQCDDYHYTKTWQAMEKLVEAGLAKAIGVSNFTVSQLKDIINIPNKVPIANNQVELHPFLPQDELVNFCHANQISVTAYSPLGSQAYPRPIPDCPSLLIDPVVNKIAEAHGVSPAVILIKYHLERDVAVIPKSVNPSRIKENFSALSIKLTAQDMSDLAGLSRNLRFVNALPMKHHPYFPF